MLIFAHGSGLELFDLQNPGHALLRIAVVLAIGLLVAGGAAWITRKSSPVSRLNLAVIVIGVATILYFILAEGQTRLNAPHATGQKQQTPAATVKLTADGYMPSLVTIRAGQNVEWTDTLDSLMWVASDPHPAHNGLPGFDQAKVLHKGDSWSFTFNSPGRFSYHDHLYPARRGVVVVTAN
jgi:plastocyanin